jgi:hypothetical protein
MSAIGPKQTSLAAPHMSAFGGKADMVIALRAAGAGEAEGGLDLQRLLWPRRNQGDD